MHTPNPPPPRPINRAGKAVDALVSEFEDFDPELISALLEQEDGDEGTRGSGELRCIGLPRGRLMV